LLDVNRGLIMPTDVMEHKGSPTDSHFQDVYSSKDPRFWLSRYAPDFILASIRLREEESGIAWDASRTIEINNPLLISSCVCYFDFIEASFIPCSIRFVS
jgi:hypothetical protein